MFFCWVYSVGRGFRVWEGGKGVKVDSLSIINSMYDCCSVRWSMLVVLVVLAFDSEYPMSGQTL